MSTTATLPTSYSFSKLNKGYLSLLNKYPLLTKAITTALFNSLNEQIASFLAGDLQHITIKIGSHKFVLPHTLTAKVPLMAFYGFAINAPFAHHAYKLLNKIYIPPLSSRTKIAQILTSMVTITPVISAITISYISLINNAQFEKLFDLIKIGDITSLKLELKSIFNKMKTSLITTFFPVVKSSWFSSPLFMIFAQKFLEPNLWVVFFSFCYFLLGTLNNTQIKKAQLLKKKQQQKELEIALDDERFKDDFEDATLQPSSSNEFEVEVIEAVDVDVVFIEGEKPAKDMLSPPEYTAYDHDQFRARQGSSGDDGALHFEA